MKHLSLNYCEPTVVYMYGLSFGWVDKNKKKLVNCAIFFVHPIENGIQARMLGEMFRDTLKDDHCPTRAI